MSVLIKRIDSASGGGSSKGYPPGNINIIKKAGANTKVYLRWSEPDNIIIGNKTLSTWSSTIIVRKEGSAPTSIKDGTVVLTNTTKNKYKDTDLVDSGLTNGKTYYYRFFIMNTDKIYNTDSSMIYAIKIIQADTILKNNSWDTIAKISEAGIASSIWKIGDEIPITIQKYIDNSNGGLSVEPSTNPVVFQIWDFNHFDKSDGTGKAGIVFGMKNIDFYAFMHDDPQNAYLQSNTRKMLNGNMMNCIPSDLKSHIKKVTIFSHINYNYAAKTQDYIFIPSITEVGGTFKYPSSPESKLCTKFPIFTDNNSRKKIRVFDNYNTDWWTRSIGEDWSTDDDGENTFAIYRIERDGTTGYQYTDRGSLICFCFNV